MAKVKLENHTEHKIHLNAPTANPGSNASSFQNEPVIVPEGRYVEEGTGQKFVPGSLDVEESHLSAIQKHPVVQHYFKEGHLRRPKAPEKQGNGNQQNGGQQQGNDNK